MSSFYIAIYSLHYYSSSSQSYPDYSSYYSYFIIYYLALRNYYNLSFIFDLESPT